MNWLLHFGLLLCGVYAVSPFCLNGEKSLIEGTRCRKYAECNNGGWYLKQCQVGEQFNPRTKTCELVVAAECKDGKEKCEEGRTFGHSGSDRLYYLCQKGRISTKYCGAGEIFDHEEGQCKLVDSVIKSHQGSIRSRRSAEETCVENDKRRSGKSCKTYLECVNGQEVKRTCPDCMNFDEVRQTCRFNMLLPCGPNSDMPTRPPTTTTPEPTTPEPTTPEPTTPKPTTPEPKPEPTTPEPKPEPTKPEPTTPEPKPEPTKPEPTTPEPKPEPTKPEPKPEPSTPEPKPETTPVPPSEAPKQ